MNILAFDVSINNGENMAKICVSVEGLQKSFKDHQNRDIVVLQDLHFKANAGEITIIMGPSGCGKSTLLNILSTIDNEFENGKVFVMDKEIKNLNESQKADFRNKNIGFIFQSHELINEFSVLENCAIPLVLQGVSKKQAHNEAASLLNLFNVPKINHEKFPRELSGGQQQRVGIIRAMINKPNIIFADEPTGNLDVHSRDIVNDELKKLIQPTQHNPHGIALIIVTHDNVYTDEKYSDSVYRFIEVPNQENAAILKYELKKQR